MGFSSVPRQVERWDPRAIQGDVAGRILTYFELIVLHPSQQFLDGNKQLIKDLPGPKLSPQDTLNGFGLYGVTVLTTDLSNARYAIVYVHPESLEGAVDVYTGYHTIPVPYGPYGQVKIRFK